MFKFVQMLFGIDIPIETCFPCEENAEVDGLYLLVVTQIF